MSLTTPLVALFFCFVTPPLIFVILHGRESPYITYTITWTLLFFLILWMKTGNMGWVFS